MLYHVIENLMLKALEGENCNLYVVAILAAIALVLVGVSVSLEQAYAMYSADCSDYGGCDNRAGGYGVTPIIHDKPNAAPIVSQTHKDTLPFLWSIFFFLIIFETGCSSSFWKAQQQRLAAINVRSHL
jgi:hypothetical protein